MLKCSRVVVVRRSGHDCAAVDMVRALASLLVAAAALTAASAAETFTSLMFQVEPKTEDCVYEDLKAGNEIDAQLLVTRGGKLDVRFRVSTLCMRGEAFSFLAARKFLHRLRTPTKQFSTSSYCSATLMTVPGRCCRPL